MGVIYKVKPEVRDFILEQKNKNPALSCRKLTALVLDNFKVELSKSSINSIIKEAGLSAPVGRTPKKKRRHIAMPNLPVLLEDNSAKETKEEIRPEEEIKPKEEPVRIIEEEKLKQEEDEKLKLKQLEEERIKLEEEAAIKLEKEKWAKLAEEERRMKEETNKKAEEEEESLRRQEEEKLAKETQEKARLEEGRKQEEADKKAKEEEERIKFAQLEEEKRAKEEVTRKEQREKEEAKGKLEDEEAKKAAEEKEEIIATPAFSIDRIDQIENSGIMLLKAADYIIGASKLIAAAIKHRLPREEGNFEDLVENLIYLPLLQGKINQAAVDKITGNLEKIENIKVMNLDISRIISSSLQEARCIKVILSDGTNLYLDASMYSAWSSPHIPYDFATPINNLKEHIKKYFNQGSPLVLFNAPGYDMPSQEFFNFLGALDGKGNRITNLVIYGNKFEELEVLPVALAQKRNFIFGVWPWQFTEHRKVKSIGEFRYFRMAAQERDLYIADIEMELRHPNLNKQMSFYGCALKTSLNEKTRLVILSNFTPEMKGSEELASVYFSHWPNLEEAFQDYSRKIELFTDRKSVV